ncbi:MAG: DUF4384 domain-containing protein [Deltaproteobacteria bacterium]
MKSWVVLFLGVCLFTANLYAAESIITEADGAACMSQGKTKTQVEGEARAGAVDKAKQLTLQYIENQGWQDQNLISSYKNATVTTLEQMEGRWENDPSKECYKVNIRAEVIPEERLAKNSTRGVKVAQTSGPPAPISPIAQLQVQAWTDRSGYRERQKITVYLRGNKPFFARVVYKDAGGSLVQLLPNPYRDDNYFSGGAIYEIPSSQDRFELEVTPPFGTEEIIVYGSTSPLGEIDVKPAGGTYEIMLAYAEIGTKTRGIGGTRPGRIPVKPTVAVAQNQQAKTTGQTYVGQSKAITEFSETTAVIKTSR